MKWTAGLFPQSIFLGVLTALVVGCDSNSTGQAPDGSKSPAAQAKASGHSAGTPIEGLPAPEKGTTQLDGLYMMVWSLGGDLNKDYYLFTSDGYFSRTPFGGIDPFDFAAAAKQYPSGNGTYTVNGNKILVHFANGKTQDIKYEVTDKGEVEFDGVYAFKAEPYPAGSKLEGKYSGSLAARHGGNVAASAWNFNFKKDGHYDLDRGGYVEGKSPTVEGSAGSSGQESGTYTLSGNTLDLKPSSGQASRYTIFPYEDYDKKIELNIDGMLFKPAQ